MIRAALGAVAVAAGAWLALSLSAPEPAQVASIVTDRPVSATPAQTSTPLPAAVATTSPSAPTTAEQPQPAPATTGSGSAQDDEEDNDSHEVITPPVRDNDDEQGDGGETSKDEDAKDSNTATDTPESER